MRAKVMVVGPEKFFSDIVKENDIRPNKNVSFFFKRYDLEKAYNHIAIADTGNEKIDFVVFYDGYKISAAEFAMSEKKTNLLKNSIFVAVTDRHILPIKEEIVMVKAGIDYIVSGDISPNKILNRLSFLSLYAGELFIQCIDDSNAGNYLTGIQVDKVMTTIKVPSRSSVNYQFYKGQDDEMEDDESLTLVEDVSELLKELSIPTHLKGYRYVRKGIEMAYDDVTLIESITKGLYPQVAKVCKTTDQKVERAIRNAIEVAFLKRGVSENLKSKIFGNVEFEKGRPTNTEFVAGLVDYLRIKRGVL